MRLKEFLKETKEKHAVLAFMRTNPPTLGHELVINKVKEIAKANKASQNVVLSRSQDKNKNPLTPEQKLKYAKLFFPGVNISLATKDEPNFFSQAEKLYKQGATHLHMVAGSDRIPEYTKLLNKYNGTHEGALFNFKSIQVHSAGERDPDAEGATGMSGSKMRKLAAENNFEEFRKGVPKHVSEKNAKELFNDVRNGMQIKEYFEEEIDINEEFQEILSEGVHDQSIFKAVFLGGGPGSGKDYVLDNTLAGLGLTEINSDKALEYLMDKNQLDKTMPESEEEQRNVVRKKAKNITELRHRLALLGRNGLIINGTADDPEKVARIKSELERLGYETQMLMVNTADEVSQQRNIERGQRGGRTVPEKIRREKWDAVQAARPELAKMFGSNYKEFDNSEDLREAPPEVVKAKKEEMLDLFRGFQEFSKAPLSKMQSGVAQQWIAKELQKKDISSIPKSGAKQVPHPESSAAEEARQMGLTYYGFGRYGKNGQVTHRSVHDKLIDVTKIKTGNEAKPSSSIKPVATKLTPQQKENLQKIRGKTKLPKLKEDYEEILSENYSLSDSSSMNLLLLGNSIDEVNFDRIEEQEHTDLLRDGNGKVRTFMLRRAAAQEAHTKNGEVVPYKNGYVVKLKRKNINEHFENEFNSLLTESIDKNIEPGLSMSASGESIARDTGEKIKKRTGKASQVTETIGDGGEMATSMSDQKENELKRKGISIKSFKAKRPIG